MTSLFFFSSGRRHTRSLCDWSSDVCSSDLPGAVRPPEYRRNGYILSAARFGDTLVAVRLPDLALGDQPRSEERRVGKECRSSRSADAVKRTLHSAASASRLRATLPVMPSTT